MIFHKVDQFIELKIFSYLNYSCSTCYNRIMTLEQYLNCVSYNNRVFCDIDCFNHI